MADCDSRKNEQERKADYEISIEISETTLEAVVSTVLLLIIDVAGALYIPTLAAEILNEGTSGSSFETLLGTGVQMAIASLISGARRRCSRSCRNSLTV